MIDCRDHKLNIGDEVCVMAQTHMHKKYGLYEGRILSFIQYGMYECANVSYLFKNENGELESGITTVSSKKIVLLNKYYN